MRNRARSRRPNRRDGERGSALVETALVFIATVSVILFIMDMGRLLIFEQYYSERARAGVRNAVVNNWTSDQAAYFVCYNTPTAPQGATFTTPGFMGVTPSQVTLTATASTTTTPAYYTISIAGIPMFTWIPYIGGKYTAPTVTASMPTMSLGATN
jgi:hypothetical protein